MTVRVFYDPQRVEQLAKKGISPQRQLTDGGAASEARTALDLVEENARLRAEVNRLRAEVDRLRRELSRPNADTTRVPGPTHREEREVKDLDDAARRFSLLELDL